ncbi:MAG: LLM class F420-dependent oxidoreductase [Gammaproteobacteria bacterium]|jgi:F420-dependent oxidoreductase-like protein|nr:LLM class F420-dependent oxidoreductase [Gammaproteobacteria bacterium]
MKLGLHLGYWGAKPIDRFIQLAQRAEDLGFDIVCTAEAYGSDVFTPLAAIATHTTRIRLGTAIMQISARTPTAAAMTAITLDHISGGRLCLGVGVSGPQVVEGWYGLPFKRPLERTREWLTIFRKILAREAPVIFDGAQYQLPYRGEDSTGLGKSLMSITHPLRRDIPVFLGAEGPKNVALAIDEFDGWFPLLLPPDRFDIYDPALQSLRAKFEILQSVAFSTESDPVVALAPVKKMLALYVGGMGAKEDNFHKRVLERAGYAEVAQRIQDLWLSGRQREAVDAVPDELADALSVTGSIDNIRQRLAAWKASPVTVLMVGVAETFEKTVAHMETLAKEAL